MSCLFLRKSSSYYDANSAWALFYILVSTTIKKFRISHRPVYLPATKNLCVNPRNKSRTATHALKMSWKNFHMYVYERTFPPLYSFSDCSILYLLQELTNKIWVPPAYTHKNVRTTTATPHTRAKRPQFFPSASKLRFSSVHTTG